MTTDVTVRGEGPGLLLAHGAGGGIDANFGLVLDDLAGDHRVVGPHYPGAGTNPVVEPLDLDGLADGLVAAGREAGLDGATVLGESLGSAVAVRAAVRHPEFVRALVLTVGFPVADPVLGDAAVTVAALTAAGTPSALAARARMLTVASLPDAALATMEPAEVEEAVAGTLATAPAGTAAHFDLVARLDVRPDLARVGVPTLVVVATGDRLVLPASHRALATGIPGAEAVEIDGAGHVMGPAHRRVWLAHVRAFLAGDGAATGRTPAPGRRGAG